MPVWTEFETKILRKEDKYYPESLRQLRGSSKKLFYKGNPKILERKWALAVVGSRKMTRYGAEMVERFVAPLVAENVVIVSGFMYGIDTQAHKAAIKFGGLTTAVFACGLDICYPPENEKLYGEIIKSGGLVISEYKDGTKPQLWTFPQRNKVVAALSNLGVLVVEAGIKSGSLITASLAAKMGHPVYAVPGAVSSSVSVGTNLLIKQSRAKMVTEASDILPSLAKGATENSVGPDLQGVEKKIYGALKREPLNIDEIAVEVGLGVVEAGSVVSVMSVKGILSESGGKFYV